MTIKYFSFSWSRAQQIGLSLNVLLGESTEHFSTSYEQNLAVQEHIFEFTLSLLAFMCHFLKLFQQQ